MLRTTRERLLEIHDESCRQAKEIMVAKNADYGADVDGLRNFRLCENLSVPIPVGIITRLGDKLARIGNLIAKGTAAVRDETIEDTILDAINYLIILRASLLEKKENDAHAS